MKTERYSSRGKWRGGYNSPLAPVSTVQYGPQRIEGRVTRVIVNPGEVRVTIRQGRLMFHGPWDDRDVAIGDWVSASVHVQPKTDTFGFFRRTV